MPHDFSDLFRPQVIAVVGASDRYGSVGRKVFARLVAERAAPLVLPVNSRHKTVGACKAYPDLAAACAEHAVDTAVVVLSADKLAALVREAGRLNIRYLVFVSDIEQPAPATAAKLDKAAEAARKAGVGLFAVPTDGAAAPRAAARANMRRPISASPPALPTAWPATLPSAASPSAVSSP